MLVSQFKCATAYSELRLVDNFIDITDLGNFVDVPDDWYIIVTDIRVLPKRLKLDATKKLTYWELSCCAFK